MIYHTFSPSCSTFCMTYCMVKAIVVLFRSHPVRSKSYSVASRTIEDCFGPVQNVPYLLRYILNQLQSRIRQRISEAKLKNTWWEVSGGVAQWDILSRGEAGWRYDEARRFKRNGPVRYIFPVWSTEKIHRRNENYNNPYVRLLSPNKSIFGPNNLDVKYVHASQFTRELQVHYIFLREGEDTFVETWSADQV